jgi:His/Glu/Gln/Arg/opine family amino acid ABC transporter permease subunit
MQFDLDLAIEILPSLLSGAMVTVALTVPVIFIGSLLALPIAVARSSENRLLSWLAAGYVTFFRGTPTLILLYLVYNGLAQLDPIRNGPLWAVFSNAYVCAIIGFALNHSSYVVEILRGGLRSVPSGLSEAASALGLSERQVFYRVQLPVAVRYGLKAYQNEVLIFTKSTAVVSAITVVDLTAAANEVFYFTYDPFTPLLTAAAIYWGIVNLMRLGFRALDHWLNRHQIRARKQQATAVAQQAELPAEPLGSPIKERV